MRCRHRFSRKPPWNTHNRHLVFRRCSSPIVVFMNSFLGRKRGKTGNLQVIISVLLGCLNLREICRAKLCAVVLLYPGGASNVYCALCNTVSSVPPPGWRQLS